MTKKEFLLKKNKVPSLFINCGVAGSKKHPLTRKELFEWISNLDCWKKDDRKTR